MRAWRYSLFIFQDLSSAVCPPWPSRTRERFCNVGNNIELLLHLEEYFFLLELVISLLLITLFWDVILSESLILLFSWLIATSRLLSSQVCFIRRGFFYQQVSFIGGGVVAKQPESPIIMHTAGTMYFFMFFFLVLVLLTLRCGFEGHKWGQHKLCIGM
jgi:hypothetical protein